MNFRITLSALLGSLALSCASLADVTNKVPTTVSGGSGTLGTIQADDGTFYTAAAGNTASIGGFTAVGGDISSVVLHVKFSVDAGGYTGTNAIRVNGINTPIIPADGDTLRTASVDITSGAFRVNTWPEITALAVSFINNDGGSGQSVHFDHAYLVITHTTPLFAPPTWSDEFDDSGPPNPAVWTFEQGFVRNEELQWYQSNNAWQQNGNLIIEGRREQVSNPNYVAGSGDWRTNRQFAQYTSSSITSQGKFSFQYGRMQVRAKIPCFPGAWPAIWTLGNTGEWPSNGECDVLEYYSPDSVLANLARGTNSRWSAAWDAVKKPVSPFFTATNPNPNWRSEYHIWTMQWDQDNIRLYIDNYLMNTTPQSWLVNPVTTWGPRDPFKQPHFLLLNLALGGAGGNPASTTFPLRYELDHVRVWEGLTGNNAPTDIAISSNSVPEGLPAGTVVGNLAATDVDAAEVHSFSLVSGAGDTHNSSFDIVFKSDQTKTSVLRTKAVLSSAGGATRSIRVRVTDIEGATYDKILTVQLDGQFVIEVAPATLAVPEGGTSTFDVRLRVAPVADVTVNVSRLSGDADLNVSSGSPLVFTPANATTWQTVTLSAAEDADRTSGTATFLCNDPSSVFLSATVLANETDNEPPPLNAVVQLSNLNQTYDGYAKTVTVTTTPAGLSHDLTYGGQFMNPTDAGDYEIVATITDPDYVGSATGTLVIAKAAQTINFAPLNPTPHNSPPFTLAATSSSGLPVSYTSSNTGVATVSGNTVTIVSAGSTTITALQAGNDNYNAATSVPQTLTVSPPVNLTWDSNGPVASQTDGAGDWTAANQWWNGAANSTWASGDGVVFGNGGTGGDVTLASPTAVYSVTFNSFTGTYTLGSAGQTITLNSGITKNAASGTAIIVSPITLGAAQSWSNNSAGLLAIGPAAVNNSGFLLSVGGTGNTNVSGAIGGAGGLTKTGAGTLSLLGSSGYAGATTVSGGTLILSNANTISAATSVAATGILQLGHATSMGTSTITLAGGATLQLRNDVNTSFTAPIATAPATAVTYNFDVNNAGGAATGRTLSLGNLTFATSTATVTNQINVTGGNGYILGLDTVSAPSSGPGGPHPLIFNPTSAAVTISKILSGSYGSALTFNGTNSATLGEFILGSNGNQSVIINGAAVTLGTTTAQNNRNSNTAAAAFTLTSGTLNLTTNSSIANLTWFASGNVVAPTLALNGGTLNNTSGSALNLGTSTSGYFNNNPAITLGGNFAFGTVSGTSANNLSLGTGAVTNAGNRTITLNGTGTTLTLGGAMTNTSGANQTTTVNGAGNTLTLGAYNLSNNASARTGTFNGTGNVTITGVVANSSNGTPASGLIYSGTGTMTLGGQNTFTGNITVSSGTLAINSTGGVYTVAYTATPIVTVSSGATLQLAAWAYGANGGLENLDAGAARLLVNGGTITYTGTGEGAGDQNNGRLFTIGTGGATLNAAGTGTWFIEPYAAYDSTAGQAIPNGLTLTLAGSANGRYNKQISGTGGRLAKSGAGTWTLAGANTYTGTTTVSGGTLQVNSPGSLHASSAVTVGTGSGGTLGGNGTINGSVTVAADGSLAPGAAVGTLAIGGALNISAPANGGSGKLNFDLGPLANTNDRIAVTGTLTIGVGVLGFNDFTFTNLGGLQVTGGTPYTLITSSGITALNTLDPANLTGALPGGLIGTLRINGNNIELAVNTAPTFAGYSVSTPYQTAATVSFGKLLAKAADADGDALSITAAGPASAQGGTALLQAASILYTPPAGFSGTDSFPLTITDARGATVIGTVTVTVGANPNTGGQGNNTPQLTMLPGGDVGIAFQGIPGRSYQIQRSTNLSTWTALATVTAAANGAVAFTDEDPPPGNAFYRLRKP